jgi:hypothetical protein
VGKSSESWRTRTASEQIVPKHGPIQRPYRRGIKASTSGLRPSSFVMCNTPVEVQFTSAGCLNYPCRTPIHSMRGCPAASK